MAGFQFSNGISLIVRQFYNLNYLAYFTKDTAQLNHASFHMIFTLVMWLGSVKLVA